MKILGLQQLTRVSSEKSGICALNLVYIYFKFVVSRVKIDKPGNPFVNSLFRLHANCKLILQINVRRINTFII